MALYLTEADVASLASMSDIMGWVADAHRWHAQGQAVDFPRQRTKLPGSVTHLLQGGLPPLKASGVKLYTSSRHGNRFWVHLFDAASGDALAVLEANWLGMMRTGAAAGVATRALARAEASRLVLFGAGWQARGQLRALACARALSQVTVVARDAARLAAFCDEMAEELAMPISPCLVDDPSLADRVRDADLISTATTASRPLLQADWLSAGVHVNAVGSNALIRQELDEATVRKATVVCVDARSVALREAGDLWPLLEKGRLHENQLVELGEVLCEFRPGRRSEDDITLFESQGMAIQDIAVAWHVWQRAVAAGVGQALPY